MLCHTICIISHSLRPGELIMINTEFTETENNHVLYEKYAKVHVFKC